MRGLCVYKQMNFINEDVRKASLSTRGKAQDGKELNQIRGKGHSNEK